MTTPGQTPPRDQPGPGTKRFGDRSHLLAYVASLYYEERRSQADIGSELGVSRSMVSRLLQDAERRGMVEVRIAWPTRALPHLADELIQRFSLATARVVDAGALPYPYMLRELGALAAIELESLLRDQMRISIAWGTALSETVRALPNNAWDGIQVIQCIGSAVNAESITDGPALARRLASRVDGTYRYLPAPLVVDSEGVCRGLVRDRTIAETLTAARQADVALVGIGTVDAKYASLVRAGLLTEDERTDLEGQGAVGDICARYFNALGQPVETPINRRTVGITLDDLRRIPRVIGVAGGRVKAAALSGALRGGYLDSIVTDRAAAEAVLAMSVE